MEAVGFGLLRLFDDPFRRRRAAGQTDAHGLLLSASEGGRAASAKHTFSTSGMLHAGEGRARGFGWHRYLTIGKEMS